MSIKGFGERIKRLRLRAGYTQLELAQKLNISNTTLSQYESELRVPSDEIKVKIAYLFDVSIDYLLGNSDFSIKNKNNISDAEVSEMLRRKFVKHGIIKEGEDISDAQLDNYLEKLRIIVDAFKKDK